MSGDSAGMERGIAMEWAEQLVAAGAVFGGSVRAADAIGCAGV